VRTTIRFAVGTPDRHSTVWSTKSRRNDVYIFARVIGGSIKVSLHEDPDHWRLAFTREHVDRHADRRPKEWHRPSEFALGLTQAFAVYVPESELISSVRVAAETETSEILWLPPPESGAATQITWIYAKPEAAVAGWPGRRSMNSSLVGRMPLASGEVVWVVAHQLPVTDTIREKVDAWHGALCSVTRSSGHSDLRANLFGSDPSGLRWFIDLSL